MRRREFIATLGAAVAQPLAARALPSATPVIGLLEAGSKDASADLVQPFRQGLSEIGFVEDRNVLIEYRWAEGQLDRLSVLAAELVRRRVTMIVATGSGFSARAAQAATSDIPIIFSIAVDPVASGFVASLARPGGNLTGVVSLSLELMQKRLELLHEAVPTVTEIAVLLNPTNPSGPRPSGDLQAAAHVLGLQLEAIEASTEREVDAALAALGERPSRALIIPPDAFFLDRRAQLGHLTLRYAIPAIHSYREFAAAGGLMAYGGSRAEQGHQVGIYAGRILKGEKTADLPVYQGTEVDLVINLRSAKSLGLTVPLSLRALATEVIE